MVVTNPCSDEDPDCSSRWIASAVLPRDYLPFQVTRFNAYAIHGEPWGDDSPDDVFYESLYPADPDLVSAPDFHYLDAFGPLDLEGEVGFHQSDEMSPLWVEATSGRNFAFS